MGGAGPTCAHRGGGQLLGSGPVPCTPTATGVWAGGQGISQAQAGAEREGDREGFRCLVSAMQINTCGTKAEMSAEGPPQLRTHNFFSDESCGSP